MIYRSKELERQIPKIQKQIKQLPKGKLICARNGQYYKWYRRIDQKTVYLPKAETEMAKQLARKKYLEHLLEDMKKEKYVIQFYLKHYPHFPKSNELLKNEEIRNLLKDYFQPLNEQAELWCKEEYEKNTLYPEHLIHLSSSGNFVRSKSECMIDTLLFVNKIPFRYECALQLGEAKVYPDFTIQHPKTGEIYYWEHFGMMDNPEYAQKAFSKQHLYSSYGIIPSHQLIITYETKDRPLNSSEIEKVIHNFFYR